MAGSSLFRTVVAWSVGGLLATAMICSARDTASPSQPKQERAFGDSTSVVAVEIPVQVLRDGEPVRGLTVDNFEVLDTGQERPIVGFETIDLGVDSASGLPPASSPGFEAHRSLSDFDSAPPAARRHFLLLFDLTFSTPASVLRGLNGARGLIEDGLHRSDLTAIALYSSTRGAQVLQPFTTDRSQLRAALGVIEALHQRSPEEANRRLAALAETWPGDLQDPLGLTLRGFQAVTQQVGLGVGVETSVAGEATGWVSLGSSLSATGAQGRVEGADVLSETLADMAELADVAVLQRRQSGVVHLAETMAALIEALGEVGGTKHLIWLSEGFDSTILEGAKVAGIRRGSSRSMNAFNQALAVFRRAGWAIQSFDIGGLREQAGAGAGGLVMLARGTGGDVYRNTNAVDHSMAQMLERTSMTYLLTIQPQDLPTDGSFRTLKVRLREVRGRVEVRHREGYSAPRPFDQQSQQQRMVHAAQLVLDGVESGELDVAVLAAALPSETGPARVPLLVEVAGADLVAGFAGETMPTEVYAYAFDSQGGVSDLFSSRLNVDLAQVGEVLARGGYKVYSEMVLDPGSYDLRVLVRNAATGAHRLVRTRVEVPDGRVAGPVLLPPLFLGTDADWVTVRAGRTDGGDYPFMIDKKSFMPAARGLLEEEPVMLCLLGFGLEGPDRHLTAAIRDSGGIPRGTGHLKILQRGGGTGEPDYLIASLDPDGLPAGDYTLTVTVKDAVTYAGSSSETSFRVANAPKAASAGDGGQGARADAGHIPNEK